MKNETKILGIILLLISNISINSMSKEEQKYEYGNTTLINAVFNNSLEDVENLLNQGVDVNLKNDCGNTALMIAAAKGNIEMLGIMIHLGKADLNSQDCYGHTPLMWAIVKGHLEIVKILINEGAYINIQNNEGRTALIYAVGENNKDMVRVLIAANADLNIKDHMGKTALMYALERNSNNIIEILTEYTHLVSIFKEVITSEK